MDEGGTRYLVVINLNPATPDRLMKAVPALKATLDRLSIAPVEQLFRSLHADYCGYLIRSRRPAHIIVRTLESPQNDYGFGDANFIEPFLSGKDSLFVIELGDKFSGSQAMSRAMTWLQHH